MSKAKELARAILEEGNNYYFSPSLRQLVDAVLSEPEPELRGWIECTSTFFDNDRVVLISTRDISSIFTINDPKDHALNAKTGICLMRTDELFNVKESYDEIKQKIRESQ